MEIKPMIPYMESYLQRLAEVESGNNPLARNPNSSAKGLYQFIDSTAKQYGLNNPYDPAASRDAAKRFTMDNYRVLESGLGRPPSAQELYLAHQQGANGALALLANAEATATGVVGQNAVLNNAGNASMNAGDFASNVKNTFGNIDPSVGGDITLEEEKELAELEAWAATQNNKDAPLTPEEEAELAALEAWAAQGKGKKDGFVSRVSEDVSRFKNRLSDLEGQYQQGKFGGLEGNFAQLGASGRLMTDVVGQVLRSLYEATASEPVEQAFKNVGQDISQSALGDLGRFASEKYSQFAQENPRTAMNLGSAADLIGAASMFTPLGQGRGSLASLAAESTGSGLKSTGKLIKEIAGSTKNTSVGQGIVARGADELDDISGQLRKVSSDTYKKAFDNGVIVIPTKNSKIMNDIENSVGRISERRHSDTASVLDDLREKMSIGGGLGLQDFDDFLQDLGDVISDNTSITGKLNSDAKKALSAKSKLEEIIDNLSPEDIQGDIQSIADLNLAKSQWSKARKFEDIANVIKDADGDPSKIKKGFKRLMKGKKFKGYTDEEKQLIKDASKNSLTEGVLKGLGRFGLAPENVFLPTVSGGLGAMAGTGGAAGALVGAGTAARQLGKYAARGKAERILKEIEKRP